MSLKTVRKVVRSGATKFTYKRSVQPQPKIGPWRAELDDMVDPPSIGLEPVAPQ